MRASAAAHSTDTPHGPTYRRLCPNTPASRTRRLTGFHATPPRLLPLRRHPTLTPAHVFLGPKPLTRPFALPTLLAGVWNGAQVAVKVLETVAPDGGEEPAGVLEAVLGAQVRGGRGVECGACSVCF